MMVKSLKKTVLLTLLGVAISAGQVSAGETIWTADAQKSGSLELTLEEAVDMALSRNPELDSVDASRQASRRQVEQARSNYWPTVTATHSESRRYSEGVNASGVVVGTHGNSFSNDFGMSWVLYSGGAAQAQVNQAKEGYYSRTYGVVAKEQDLKKRTTEAYFKALQADKSLEYAEESLARVEEHVKNVTLQYEVGLVAKADLLRSEVEAANTKQTLIRARNNRDLAYASLTNLVWVEMDTRISLKDELAFVTDSRSLADSIEFAKLSRPEIHQALSALESSKSSVRSARAGYIPTVSVNAGYTRSDNESRSGWEREGWNVGGSVRLTLFDSFQTRGRVGEAMANQEKSEADLKTAVQGIELEVRTAWLNMQEARERIETSSVAVNLAEEDYKIAQARYMAGVGTNLDVIDSQSSLTNAQTNYVTALYDYNNSRANLDKAMGVGVARPDAAMEDQRGPVPAEFLEKKIEELRKNPKKIEIFPRESNN